jgi:outer membrane lipoprotein-sorting protein
MRKTLISQIALLCLLSAPYCRAADDTADTAAFLDRFSASVAEVSVVFSTFEQQRHMALLADPIESSGTIIFETPNRLRWDTVKPYRSVLIANGKDVAQFEEMDGVWKKLNIGYAAAMGKVMDSVALIWRGNLAGQQDQYRFSLKPGEEPVLTLTPSDSGMRKVISAIELHFQKNLASVSRVVLKEPGGDRTVIRLVSQKINPALPKGVFDLEKPTALEDIRRTVAGKEGDE